MRGVTSVHFLSLSRPQYFNSHASCEAWQSSCGHYRPDLQFQLTRLMRGVTSSRRMFWMLESDFNSHASCEAWRFHGLNENIYKVISTHTPHARRDDGQDSVDVVEMAISTHTPHARRDVLSDINTHLNKNFNSHASCEAWLRKLFADIVFVLISTHTPHARRDITII